MSSRLNKNLQDFFAKVNCNNDESSEDRLRRQLKEKEDELEKLKKLYHGQNRQNQTLKNRVDELLDERNEKNAEIQRLENKLSAYIKLEQSFPGIDGVVNQKIKAEMREIKIAKKTAIKKDENDPDNEIQCIGIFPSRVSKRQSDEEFQNVPRKRKTMEDRFNDLSLEDHQSASSSSHFPSTQ